MALVVLIRLAATVSPTDWLTFLIDLFNHAGVSASSGRGKSSASFRVGKVFMVPAPTRFGDGIETLK